MSQVSFVFFLTVSFVIAAVVSGYSLYNYDRYWRKPYDRYDYGYERYYDSPYPLRWNRPYCIDLYGYPCYRYGNYYDRYPYSCRYGNNYCQDPYYSGYYGYRYDYDPYRNWYPRGYSKEAEKDDKED
ncbi:putative eggshell protein [Limulus polyphemus]|uniref:Eggshell protein n=1 Tax=Limulus polyphemus TaxID=6850 RepID=A0ABM1BDX0_LIMPO|nr:putative eggshell protein [Limulus polyphemus]